jgi:hypothetical protein
MNYVKRRCPICDELLTFSQTRCSKCDYVVEGRVGSSQHNPSTKIVYVEHKSAFVSGLPSWDLKPPEVGFNKR